MRLAPTLAVALAALAGGACATAGRAPREVTRPRQDLVSLARTMVAIDQLAERRGDEILAERQQRSANAEANSLDVVARFLAVWAQPRGEDRWGGFKQIAREFPESALGQVGMASVYVEWRTLDQADKSVALALDVEPDNWLAVLYRAATAEKREKLEFAATDYRTVLSADPANPEAHLGLARIARKQGDAARTKEEAQAALATVPDHLGALGLLADLAVEKGETEEAAALVAKIVATSPKDRPSRLRLARLYRAAGKPALAKDQLRAALEMKEDAEVLVMLADAAKASGDLRTEIEAVERLSALDPSAGEWRRIGEYRLASGDWEGAEKALRKALAREPRDPAANAALGKIHLHRGEPQEAVEVLRIAGDPGKPDLVALERRLNLDRVSRPDVGQLQKAVQGLVDRTYRTRAQAVPSLSGELKVRVTVNPAGEATQVELLEDTIHDADVRACAYWNLRDASYPTAKPGRFTFGFAFTKR
jgi:tetratricopeptide (TPR) repeat protein